MKDGKTHLAGRAFVRVGNNQRANKVLGVAAHVLPISLVEDNGALSAFFEEVGEGFAAEWRVAAQQSICNDTH